MEEYKFVPHHDLAEISLRDYARLSSNIGLENHSSINVTTVELFDVADNRAVEELLSPFFLEALSDTPLIQADVQIFTTIKDLEKNELLKNINIIDPTNMRTESNALLTVGHRLLSKDRSTSLNLLLNILQDGGFIISRESASMQNLNTAASKLSLEIIMEKRAGKELLVLLRKKARVSENTVVIYVDNFDLSWISEMQAAMKAGLEKEHSENLRVVVVGEGTFDNGLLGLINCLRMEPGGKIFCGVLIQDPQAPKFSLNHPIYASQIKKDLALSVLRPNGIWGSYRHLPLPPLAQHFVYHGFASQLVPGDLSTVQWLEAPAQPCALKSNFVRVVYSSINSNDLMLATGKRAIEMVGKTLPTQERGFGVDFCGMNSSDCRVMGMIKTKGLTNLCRADTNLIWYIPDNWSLEDAATVPMAYVLSYYALHVIGRLKRGDKILIHSGSGGVGQAAINIALHEGCEVFTTVGSPEKRRFIRQTFPQIQDDHIGNSRDTSYEEMIMQQTNCKGVDVILNSLAEDKFQASMRSMASNGRFLEIGKNDLLTMNFLGMEIFQKSFSFHSISIDAIFELSDEQKLTVKNLLIQGLQSGAIKPLSRTTFPKNQLEAAFRYMAGGNHIGKVLIKIRDGDMSMNSSILAYPRYYCMEDRCYVIIGGLGGFGVELADWLVLRGAKNIVLISRNGPKNGYQKMRIECWKSRGTKVVIITGKDASQREDCKYILKTATDIAPVDGIFNTAVVLNDDSFLNYTMASFEECFKCKAWSTKQLDELSRIMCPQLRHFVVFSTISCGRGTVGQTNYGMSNSVMERICEQRVSDGLPGLAIQWGALGNVGLVANMQEDYNDIVVRGTLQQRLSSCLQELDCFMQQNRPVVASMIVADMRVIDIGIVETILNILGS